MSYSEHHFRYTNEYLKLKKLYESFFNNTSINKGNRDDSIVNNDDNDDSDDSDDSISQQIDIKFDTFQGDITKGIKWCWAGNSIALEYFTNFFESIDLDNKLLALYSNKFYIRGASFITLNQREVLDSNFHLDAMSPYDDDNDDTNILTIIFPLYEIDKLMGHLEYKSKEDTKIYTYKKNRLVIWDSCKFLHRTQPYSIPESRNRVLVSINLSTQEDWARYTISNCLKGQGAKYIIN